MFVKITNLIYKGRGEKHGQADYKGIDIDNIVAGSQAYDHDDNSCTFEVHDDIESTHDDLTILSEAEHNILYNDIQNIPAKKSAETIKITQLEADKVAHTQKISELESSNSDMNLTIIELWETIIPLMA